MPLAPQLLIWMVGVIFGAGTAWGMLRQQRRDLNGIGRNQRRFEKNFVLAVMTCKCLTDEDRLHLAQFLKDP